MKSTIAVIGILLFSSSLTWSQVKTYSKIDESVAVDNGASGAIGWGSCVTCAGGGPNGSVASSPFITTPSVDGASRDFNINGSAYTNGLWWYKVGTNDAASNFMMDFWLNTNSDTQHAQALEFDVFQFDKQIKQFSTGTEFMFGTQCNYAAGVWDVWDSYNHKWVHTKATCNRFKANTWYHVTLNFHRTPKDNFEHYDSVMIVQFNNNGKIVDKFNYNWNLAFASSALPAGWGEDLGLQFQMDIANAGANMTEYVDGVTLTAW